MEANAVHEVTLDSKALNVSTWEGLWFELKMENLKSAFEWTPILDIYECPVIEH